MRLGVLSIGLLAPHRAQAGVAEFIAACMANSADLSGLPARLESQGYVEVDMGHAVRALPQMRQGDAFGRSAIPEAG